MRVQTRQTPTRGGEKRCQCWGAWRRAVTGLAGIAALAAASLPAGGQEDKDVFATVGGEPVSVAAFEAALHRAARQKFFHGLPDNADLAALRQQVRQNLIQQVMLLQEARRRGLLTAADGARSDIRAIRALREQVYEAVAPPAESDVRAYYRAHADRFTTPERLRVALILLKVQASAGQAVWQAAYDEAARLREKINKGADFAALARIHSADPSAQKGGDLGEIHRGMLAPPAERALEKLKPGETSEPVVLLQGVALFRLVAREAPRLNPFGRVAERAKGLLLRERREEAWAAFKNELEAKTPVVMGADWAPEQ